MSEHSRQTETTGSDHVPAVTFEERDGSPSTADLSGGCEPDRLVLATHLLRRCPQPDLRVDNHETCQIVTSHP